MGVPVRPVLNTAHVLLILALIAIMLLVWSFENSLREITPHTTTRLKAVLPGALLLILALKSPCNSAASVLSLLLCTVLNTTHVLLNSQVIVVINV